MLAGGRWAIAAAAVLGAALVAADGRRQFLCAVYSVAALDRAAQELGSGPGLAMRDLVAGLELEEVAATPEETRDLDTWQDLTALRRVLGD